MDLGAKKKKIMFLGAARQQVPPILYALQQGHHVVTCDNLPNNPGHQLAHDWHFVSTTDKERVLDLARRLDIDGIVSYASDPAAPTQAFVAEELGLVGNPYSSVLTLTRKDLFREFLATNGFLTPKWGAFENYSDAEEFFHQQGFPMLIKPVDSSGSKGVKKILASAELKRGFENAKGISRSGTVILEEFIPRVGRQIAGDGFAVAGKLRFRGWGNEHFSQEGNPLVPIGESFPAVLSENLQAVAHSDFQRILSLLQMRVGALNFDFQITQDSKVLILELGPRNGGNLIPEVVKLSMGVDMIKFTVDSALGLSLEEFPVPSTLGYFSSLILHSPISGVVKGIFISDYIRGNIHTQDIDIRVGDFAEAFNGSNNGLGTFILKFDSEGEMLDKMDNISKHIRVLVG